MLPPPESTRLVTIIAHVDHGKTTLADNLVESNGIISERLAGTLRYLDSDAEEQRRGITMRASAIGLRHLYNPPKLAQKGNQVSNPSEPRQMVVHLIDSPGHVDFSAEVTSSLLLCDSAILVVDAVEGLCARTHSLVREAYMHQMVPVLVVNKVDRLCTELGLDPTESYVRLRELIESMNAVCASMINSATPGGECDSAACDERREVEEMAWNFDPVRGNVVFASALHGWGFTVPTLARSLFKTKTIPMKPPMLRQYLFGDFKYNYKSGKVLKWKPSGGGSGEPMFAEFALAPLWEIYEGISQAASSVGMKSELFNNGMQNIATKKTEHAKIVATTSGMERVISSIQLGSTALSVISPQSNGSSVPKNTDELQQILSRVGAGSESSIVSAVMRRYRPLSDSVLDAVCETGPSPADATKSYRTKTLALRRPARECHVALDELERIQQAVRECDSREGAPTVAHVCKFAPTSRASVNDPELPALKPDEDPSTNNMLLGIARVLSGTLRTEDVDYHMFGPRYCGSESNVPKQRIRCYLLMGAEFVKVDSVPAGHICAIYNLEALNLKTVTICDRRNCMPLRGFDFGLQPLVKVNVEALSAAGELSTRSTRARTVAFILMHFSMRIDTNALERGLLKLSLADSSVEVTATAKGERILACLGEIHLEQAILELENTYCERGVKLRISDPITAFCETTDWFTNEGDFESFLDDKSPPLRQATIPPYCDEEGLAYANRGRCRTLLSGRGAAISMRAIPLPRKVYECLRKKHVVEGSEDELVAVAKALRCFENESLTQPETALEVLLKSLDDIDDNGNALIECSLLSRGYSVKSVKSTNGEVYMARKNQKEENDDDFKDSSIEGLEEYQSTREMIRKGLIIANGGLDGVSSGADSVALEKWSHDMRGSALAGFQLAMRAGPLCEEPVRGVAVILEACEIAVDESGKVAKEITGGMTVAALRQGIRCCLLTRPARLVEGHLRLTLHSSLSGLGSLHAVLSKRRGKVIRDDMVDGTDLIQVTATIPQAESFGLAPELLKKSSGEVTAPELVFSHFDYLDEDPFWVPQTQEEREDFGSNLVTGDSSTGLNNTALKYIRMVRNRKGLLVDSSKIVVAAEKQRTLSRKK